ncbi:MAG: hypothetical protein QOG77_11 [Solirubrobacteraceae bacterium]|nr:hypothetical protein [Solirubrobacteraceae bacterium]
MGAEHTLDPGALAERRAQRIIGGQARRRTLLRRAPRPLRVSAFLTAILCGCAVLYGWGAGLTAPVVLLVAAVVLACLAGQAERAAPAVLTGRARAELTVREAWRVLRADADEVVAYPRHAIWAAEAPDGTVQLWRLTRDAGVVPAADGDYAITATLLEGFDGRDTVGAAEAMADARGVAWRDEQDAMQLRIEADGLARALRAAGGS